MASHTASRKSFGKRFVKYRIRNPLLWRGAINLGKATETTEHCTYAN